MRTLALFVAAVGLVLSAQAPARSPSREGALVYIVSPENGAQVSSPVTVVFGLRAMGVAPAGVEKAGTGHHHLLIDVEGLPDLTRPIPADDQHRHFGGGQTEASLALPPGTHTLQLLLGDHTHTPHDPPVISQRVTVTVK